MIHDFNKVKVLLNDIDVALRQPVRMYIIGGATLLYRGIKPATKDIDIVVETRAEFLELRRTLDAIDFFPTTVGKEYSHMNLSQIFQKGEFRIDLFEKEVCGRFSLTKPMMQRAEPIATFQHLHVFLCSNEDIFLFKTMTEREGDLLDCISIATTQNPNWNIILEELQHQMKNSNQDVWVTWVGERLDILKDRGLDIPILKDIDVLRDQFFDELETRSKTLQEEKNDEL